jgi:S1-C subfamily serine protease
MVRRSGQQGVPVIAIDDRYIVGFDRPRIEQALAAAGASRPAFGASVADVSSASVRGEGLPTAGAYIGRVRAGSTAQRAGLAAGDVIVELNGKPVRGAEDLQEALSALPQEAEVTLGWVRRGERKTATVRLL